jgi:glucosamine-6-phosphate deaminase
MNHMSKPKRFTTGANALRVVVADTAEEAVQRAVLHLAAYIARSDAPRVGLATGRTFESVYATLRQRAHEFELSRATFTHLDEYADVPSASVGSMTHELRTHLFDALEPAPRFVPIDACGPDAATRLAAWHKEHAPGFQFVGLGGNGHIAFNEPGTSLASASTRLRLSAATVATQGDRFPDGKPRLEAVTMGPREILATGELVMLVTGKSKALAVQAMLEGPIDSTCPASLVRLHPNATVILDPEAASQLTRRTSDRSRSALEVRDALTCNGPILCVAPHPDDASISCGAALAMARAPRKIILGATTGSRAPVRGISDPSRVAALREQELTAEAQALGCEALFLRARGYDSNGVEDDDVNAAATMLAEILPAVIQLPSLSDPHPTHRMTRQLFEAAIEHARRSKPDWCPEIWTFEGPWYQHNKQDINLILHHDQATEARKLAAVRAHKSQVDRVPFDEGAKALARLRGTQFSESHFGGLRPEGLSALPLLECYVRDRLV